LIVLGLELLSPKAATLLQAVLLISAVACATALAIPLNAMADTQAAVVCQPD
jgi:hypothetical protein